MIVIKFVGLFMSFLVFGVVSFETIYRFKRTLNPHPYYEAKILLESNKELQWIQRSNLNKIFLGGSFHTNEHGFRETHHNLDTIDTLVLGPSSAVGWNVNNGENYSDVLRSSYGVKTFNASQIGYDLKQGIKLYDKFFKNNKNIKKIIIAFGVNELDLFPFWKNEKNLNNTLRAYFTSIDYILDLYQSFSILNLCTEKIQNKKRISISDFESLLLGFIKRLKTDSKHVILLNTASSYKSLVERSRKVIDKSSDFYFKEYNRRFDSGDCSGAKESYNKAKTADIIRIENDLKKLNYVFKDIALTENIPLVDIVSIINNKNENFTDHIHFSKEGNIRIAKAIYEEIKN